MIVKFRKLPLLKKERKKRKKKDPYYDDNKRVKVVKVFLLRMGLFSAATSSVGNKEKCSKIAS